MALTDPQTKQLAEQLINYSETSGGSFANGINITTNGFDDHVFVRSTLRGTTSSINTAGGSDSIVVSSVADGDLGQLNDLRGALKIDGGSGQNDLHFSVFLGTTNQNVTVTSTQILGLAGPTNLTPIDFKATGGQLSLELNGSDSASAVESFLIQSPAAVLALRGNGGNDTIKVESLTKAANIFGGTGNDQIQIGAANQLSGIQANLTVAGDDGQDTLSLNDQSRATPGTYSILGNFVTRSGISPVFFNADVEQVSLNTGIAADTIQVGNQPISPSFIVNAGGGSDQLTGPNSINTWVVNQQNGRTLNNNLQFTNVENIRGGTNADRFVLTTNGSLTGLIQEQGGIDTLDYSSRSLAVSVKLQTQTATSTGGVQGVENVIGGSGDDYLSGDMTANKLEGGAGNDILLGREGNDSLFGGTGRDILIGGTSVDLLNGNEGEDILIAGRTAHDNNMNNLLAIRHEWTRNDTDYTHRINNLKLGIGPNQSIKLNAAAIIDDNIIDNLFGNEDLDWFWARTSGPALTVDQLSDAINGEAVN